MTSSDNRDLNERQLSGELKGLLVLVVEDSWEVAAGLTGLLKAWGADVLGPVATTSDALRLSAERTADAAIVDLSLRDGERAYGLIDRLHDLGIRVVLVSGYANVSLAEGKVAAILQKPMKPDLLLQSLLSGQNKELQ